ncbi:uncharacterized protein BXZ73DRAFT_54282 [Epithele typhae]|uniref:uncharacterized protein n=1 Tax=Epithele typhae TaxID=378194 RepID=UPI0020077A27|nr:uncharacterized protein BXZ73DRAFT_54282 [Epithele typhae]KAH9915442.1 hypothetical protein BXZ73DRAFT_54282 [Epithele typhae]
MPGLPTIPLPLAALPHGFQPGVQALTDASNTTAFDTGLDIRDIFLGIQRCVVCGSRMALHHAHIIPKVESDTWAELDEHEWLPENAKISVKHEQRNGLMLCATHHIAFDSHQFFIRFVPGPDGDMQRARFVFINYAEFIEFVHLHYKAIALDPQDRYSPIPSLFVIQEWRVRGRYPFRNTTPDCPDDIKWADWISSTGILRTDGGPGHFARPSPPRPTRRTPARTAQLPAPMASGSGGMSESSTSRPLPHINDAIADILAAQRKMPTWRACTLENTSWDGTADENIEKYVATVGLEHSGAR